MIQSQFFWLVRARARFWRLLGFPTAVKAQVYCGVRLTYISLYVIQQDQFNNEAGHQHLDNLCECRRYCILAMFNIIAFHCAAALWAPELHPRSSPNSSPFPTTAL